MQRFAEQLVTRLKREYGGCKGRYRPLLLEPPYGSRSGKTCLSLISRAVSSTATEAPFTYRTRPQSGVLRGDETWVPGHPRMQRELPCTKRQLEPANTPPEQSRVFKT